MSKNTSITLGSYFDQFIQSVLREGRYKNASEAVRAGLRLLEEEEQKILSIPLEPQPVFFVSFFVPVVCSRSRPIDRAEEKPVNEYQHTQRKKNSLAV